MISQAQWQRAKTVFLDVVDLPTDQHEAYIREQCDTAALQDEVRLLIKLHLHESCFLISPLEVASAPPDSGAETDDPLIGQQLGDFQIIHRVAAGGMGAVYAARQQTPNRMVAIKLLFTTGLDSLARRRRLDDESRALARLQHPGIAHIYATGTCDLGRGDQPWIAMELIEGEPLSHCQHAIDLDLDQQLEILLAVCEAVQHAHDRGIIHRDLKPGNILVQRDSSDPASLTPKVVDFGVAMIASPDGNATLTGTPSEIVGTLNYMSPEMVSPSLGSVSERSDMFALGAIGFEWLSGELPYNRHADSILDAIRLVEECSIAPMARWPSAIKGDLRAIFNKALQRDPAARYRSVRDFADDLQRFREREPIRARPPSAMYRLQKFISRNRILAGGVLATILAMAVGLALFAVEASHARRAAAVSKYEAEKANAVSSFITNDFLMKLLAARLATSGTPTAETAELVRQSAESIDAMFDDRPSIEAAVRNEIATIYYNLGLGRESAEQFTMALELWESQLGPDHVDTLKAVNNLGQAKMLLREIDDAERLFRRALAGRMAQLGEDDSFTLATMNNLAEVCRRTERMEEAERLLSRAVELGQARFGLTDKHTMIAAANLGSVWIQTGKIDQAKKLHLDVLENCKKTLGENHITTMYAGSRAAQTLLKADEPERALETIQPVFEQFYALRGETHHDTITVRRVLARIYRALNQSEAARDQLEHAVKAAESDPKQFSQLAQQIRSELQQLNK